MPYLIVRDASEFLNFVQEVFQAEVKMEHSDDNGRVVHAEIVIGDSTIMVGESNDDWKPQPGGLYINVDSADERYRKALNAGATTVMELSNQSYGRTSGVMDPSGNTWWITSAQ